MHRRSGTDERVDFFFTATRHTGQVVNLEPDKCDGLRWAESTDLPNEMVPYVRAAIEAHRTGARYAEFGWHPDLR
jgi:8-oxo-dGTP diphosphatase